MSRVRDLSDFFEYLPVPLYRSAPDGRLLAGNRALAQILGFRSFAELQAHTDEVIGFYVDPSVRETWLAAIRSSGVVHDFDVELRRKDGQLLWVRDTARAVIDEDGNVLHFEGCLIDVSDRVRLEHSRDRLVATVSHELRSPITAIYGLGSELSTRYGNFSDQERSDMIALITREAEEASWLIEDLLVAHRADLAGVSISVEPFAIGPEVDRVLELVQTEIPISGDPTLMVKADPLRTRQVIRNLITNALRYGGDETEIQVWKGAGSVEVAVCDSGGPIDPLTLATIFEPFVSARADAESVGLGLWISKRLSELMGGAIRYEHEGGQSRFVLELPAV